MFVFPVCTIVRKTPISDKGSSRFLKKAAQKLLLCWGMGVVADIASGPA
jgi:hypothetical protein